MEENKSNIDMVENKESKDNIEKTENTENKKNKKSALRIIVNIVNILLWTIIILLTAVLVITITSNKTDFLGIRMYTIMSGSMETQIHVGDLVVTYKTDDPKVNDVIAFEHDGSVTVHRVIEELTEGGNKVYRTKGDYNNAPDQDLVHKSEIKGKVVIIAHSVGNMILFLQKNFIILIIAAAVLIFIILVRRLI